MRLFALTGGIASGKTTFADALRRLGAPVIDADKLARAATEPGTPELAQIAAHFGPEFLDSGGRLDRSKLAERVFSDDSARRHLEAIIHPAVRRALEREVADLRARAFATCFYDVPLLFEAGRPIDFDSVILVYAPRDLQLYRLTRLRGYSSEQAEARLGAQLPIDEKLASADVVVWNDGTLEDLKAKAPLVLADLTTGQGRLPSEAPKRY